MNITATKRDAYRLFHNGIQAFARAERQGMRIDLEYCEQAKQDLQDEIKQIEQELLQTKFVKHWQHIFQHRFNLRSDDQLGHMLYKVKKIDPPKTTKTGKGSTDYESLSQLDIPEIEQIVKIRKLEKIKNTYLEQFIREQINGILHPVFNLHLVKSYRSSSDSPNFQNVPKRDEKAQQIVRQAIYPRKGHHLLEVDYSGIEVRIACCYTRDKKLIDDTIHGDMHKDMAMELYQLNSLDKSHPGEYNLRQGGKNGFVFPQFYGDYYGNCTPNLLSWAARGELKDGTPALHHLQQQGLIRLNEDGTVANYDRFERHVKEVEDQFWHERYRTFTQWKKRHWRDYQRNGYVDMLTGFRCSGVMKENQVINYVIQGAAFHCLLWSFIELDRLIQEEQLATRLIGQIHDSIVLDVPPDELDYIGRLVEWVMCEKLPSVWKWIIVPLEVDMDLSPVSGNWYEQKEWRMA